MASNELKELTDLINQQNINIESLEKELTDLCVKSKTSKDSNAQLVKQLAAENSQLKTEIATLTSSLNKHSFSVSTPSTCNLTPDQKYDLITRNLQEIVGADRIKEILGVK